PSTRSKMPRRSWEDIHVPSPSRRLISACRTRKNCGGIPASVIHWKEFVNSTLLGRKRFKDKRASFLLIGRRPATALNSRPVPLHGAPQTLAEIHHRLVP